MRIAQLGEMVIVVGVKSNGSEEQVGFITRVWGPTKDSFDVNVSMLLDGAGCDSRTHVRVFESRDVSIAKRDAGAVQVQDDKTPRVIRHLPVVAYYAKDADPNVKQAGTK